MTEEFVASVFGMKPRNVTQMPSDEREALSLIMAGAPFPSIRKKAPQAQEKAPSATSMANAIAFEYGVEPATAIRWLAERADEFKTLHESIK